MTKTAKEPRVNFTVRLPWALRQRVHAAAHMAGQSVNEWMVDALTRKSNRAADPQLMTPPEERKNAPD